MKTTIIDAQDKHAGMNAGELRDALESAGPNDEVKVTVTWRRQHVQQVTIVHAPETAQMPGGMRTVEGTSFDERTDAFPEVVDETQGDRLREHEAPHRG